MRLTYLALSLFPRKQMVIATGIRLTAAAVCFAAAAAFAAPTYGNFIAARHIGVPAGASVGSLATGDINRDGRVDFVGSVTQYDSTTGTFTGQITSLLSNGDGTVRAVTAIASHGQTVAALADLDGDGIPDLVCFYVYDDPNVYRQTDTDVEISHGVGDGTFTHLYTYTLANSRHPSVAVGDVNGDGKPDLVVASDSGFSVLLNDGSGAFHSGGAINEPNTYGYALQDVNRDGRSDLVIPVAGNKLVVALGTSAGGFSTPTIYTTSADPRVAAVGDLNGDGNPDIAVGTVSGVDIFLGDGSGKFVAGKHVSGGPVTSMKLSNLDKNGTLDLILVNDSQNGLTLQDMPRLSVFPGAGDGTFVAPRVYNCPEGGTILGVLDANGDKTPDVVLADLTYFPGDGYGSLGGAPITRSPDAGGIVVGDFNHDGKPDIAVANIPECTNGEVCEVTVSVFLGNGTDWLPAAKIAHTGITGAYTPVGMGIAAGDVNGDGKLDLVLKGGDTVTLSVLLGNGDGTFQAPKTTDVNDGSLEVQLADVNNDKKLDVILSSGVLLGNGNGTFGAAILYPDYGQRGISKVAVADLNGDGKPDLIASIDTVTGPYTNDTYALAVLFGDGTGHFTKESEWATDNFVTQIIPAKMNGDNATDIVVGFGSGLSDFPLYGMGISVYVNKGDGTFPNTAPPFYYTTSRYITVGDFTGDGINDVAGLWNDALIVLPGTGDGTLGTNVDGPFPNSLAAIDGPLAAADLNGDGALDIVTANLIGVSRYINGKTP